MKKTRPVAAMAAVIAVAAMAPAAYAQTKPVQGWQPQQQHEEPDPAKRVPEARQSTVGDGSASQTYAQPQAAVVQPQSYDEARSARQEEGRGGFFVGVQGGKGWVYEDVDQSALAVNAGYRWQAGAVSLIGIEVASGRLDGTTDDGWRYDEVELGSVGVNARFNFGRSSAMYGLVRAGYWSADSDSGMDVDGGYFGLGLGVDVNRYFNLSLVYTNYVYFNDWEGDGFQYEDVTRADTLMLGAEVRF